MKILSSLFQPRSVDFSLPFSSILHIFVAHTRISISVLLTVAASAEYKFALLPPFCSVSFSLFCLYSRPRVVSRFPVTVSFWLKLAFHLAISFRFPSVRTCNALSSAFIIPSLRFIFFLYSLSCFSLGRCSFSIGVDIRRCIQIYTYSCMYLVFRNLELI